MKDKVYDHFNHRWLDFEQNETLNVVKGILAGVLVTILMGVCSLAVLIAFWR